MESDQIKINDNQDTRTILVFEDDELMLNLYEAIFTKRGMKVILRNNCENGPEDIESIKPDMIIVDAGMPVVSGIELLSEAAEVIRQLELPVLIVSAFDSSLFENDESGIVGMNIPVMSKPFQIDKLVDKVLALMDESGRGLNGCLNCG